jgi:protein-disulfide isomerase
MSFSRFVAAAIAGCFCLSGMALADSAAPLTPAQTQAVDQLIHDYLVGHPQVLIEVLQKAEDDAKAEAADTSKKQIVAHRDELLRDPTSPVMGNADGDVTVVEFFDYRCPFCKASASTVQQLLASDKKIRLVMKDYPVLGPDSTFASRVALVAQKHGKYAEFHDAMFAMAAKVTPETTLAAAQSVGLDTAMVKREMSAPDIDATLKRNYDLGRAVGADGTPTFVIGDVSVASALELKDLQSLVALARKS